MNKAVNCVDGICLYYFVVSVSTTLRKTSSSAGVFDQLFNLVHRCGRKYRLRQRINLVGCGLLEL